MRPALDHQDLVGAADGGQAVRDHERRAALHQVREALLDQRLRLGVEARGRLVEDQDARVGEDGARDRHALALAARELDPALAHDRVVAVRERSANSSTRAMRQAARTCSSVASGPREGDVLADRAVEQERLLQHDAELRAVASRGATVERSTPSTRTRPAVGVWNAAMQADDRGLAGAGRADERRDRARPARGTRRRSAPACPARRRSRTSSNATSPSMRGQGRRCAAGPRPRGVSRSTSRVRSRPASASVSCVPIATIWKSGATRKPSSSV